MNKNKQTISALSLVIGFALGWFLIGLYTHPFQIILCLFVAGFLYFKKYFNVWSFVPGVVAGFILSWLTSVLVFGLAP